MRGATYDTGALVAAERGDRRLWARHGEFLARGIVPVVPAPVLAEAWRGGSRQANLSRLLAMCAVEPMGAEQARRVGELAGAAAHDDVVDVTVVEGALRRDDVVLTSDVSHLRRVAAAASGRVRIEAVSGAGR